MTANRSRSMNGIGVATVATGVCHNLLGSWMYRRQLAGMARDGVVDTVKIPGTDGAERRLREVALWFLMSGSAFVTLGAALRRTTADDPAVVPIGVGMAAMGVVGAAALPRSGAWLLIAEGLATLSAARRARR